MQAAAGLGMEREKANQAMAAEQVQADSQDRLAAGRNSVERASNESRERLQDGALGHRKANFDMGMQFDYAGLQKRNALRWQQALLGNLAGDL